MLPRKQSTRDSGGKKYLGTVCEERETPQSVTLEDPDSFRECETEPTSHPLESRMHRQILGEMEDTVPPQRLSDFDELSNEDTVQPNVDAVAQKLEKKIAKFSKMTGSTPMLCVGDGKFPASGKRHCGFPLSFCCWAEHDPVVRKGNTKLKRQRSLLSSLREVTTSDTSVYSGGVEVGALISLQAVLDNHRMDEWRRARDETMNVFTELKKDIIYLGLRWMGSLSLCISTPWLPIARNEKTPGQNRAGSPHVQFSHHKPGSRPLAYGTPGNRGWMKKVVKKLKMTLRVMMRDRDDDRTKRRKTGILLVLCVKRQALAFTFVFVGKEGTVPRAPDVSELREEPIREIDRKQKEIERRREKAIERESTIVEVVSYPISRRIQKMQLPAEKLQPLFKNPTTPGKRGKEIQRSLISAVMISLLKGLITIGEFDSASRCLFLVSRLIQGDDFVRDCHSTIISGNNAILDSPKKTLTVWDEALWEKSWLWCPLSVFVDGVSVSGRVRHLCIKGTLANWPESARRRDSSIFEIAMIDETRVKDKDGTAAMILEKEARFFDGYLTTTSSWEPSTTFLVDEILLQDGLVFRDTVELGCVHNITQEDPDFGRSGLTPHLSPKLSESIDDIVKSKHDQYCFSKASTVQSTITTRESNPSISMATGIL
ncbi:hypothetical protein ADUPG1_009068 [Aduncisulcus paluster]|uniref:Uncharacterized protein n=1 Tax=Aduncisulcus paluster TaxID=2918883 RepID=A0ABQ5KU98_9EUKA|nr:hypothetical protein ADUPG1_009068 [Aduncisulcus paluster]